MYWFLGTRWAPSHFSLVLPAQPKTEAPGERVPHPGLWLQQQQQEQQEQQGRHPPRLEAHGSQSSPRGPRLHSRERSREHHRYPYRQCHGYRVAGARQQHVPGRGLRWASATGWPRHLGAWGGGRAGSQDSQQGCSLSCGPHGLRPWPTRMRALVRARSRTPAWAQDPSRPIPPPPPPPPTGGTAPGRQGLHHRTSLRPPDALPACPPA
ncbi:immediate early response gene 5-like protein [Panthera pardus]|uniref:Immediate early response gene 5-like protein n=1 Tax=Panthera pardus TaxID=9691 RepID=A0A9W2V1W3_PANPR|nr:immediate early response gene 5-like protein [Panthera pardus]